MSGQGILCRAFCQISNSRILFNNKLNHVNFQISIMGIKQETKDIIEKLQIPEKPKKPATGYLRYANEIRPKLASENPGLKPSEMVKKMAAQWKQLSDESKEKYVKESKAEQEKYHMDIVRYTDKLTPKQKEALKILEEEKKKQRRRRRIRKLEKENNKPKKPVGGYMLYLKELSNITNKPLNILLKESKGTWTNLSDEERDKYMSMYYEEKVKYDKALVEWEQRMIQEGRKELVRAKILADKPAPIGRIKKTKKQADADELEGVPSLLKNFKPQ